MIAETSMQQLPDLCPLPPIRPAIQHSSVPIQSTASIVLGVLYVPVTDLTRVTRDSLLAQNGWSGRSRLNFDASPEDDLACGCEGLLLDMSGRVMRKMSRSSSNISSGQKHLLEVTSSSWELAECRRLLTVDDVVHVSYEPSESANVSDGNWGGWNGGRVIVRVQGIEEGFSCCGEVPEGNAAGDLWRVTYVMRRVKCDIS
jgi:hypothetical protein